MSLGGEPEAPGARQSEKFQQMLNIKRLESLIGSFFRHILIPLPPKVEPASDLVRSFLSFFSRVFLAMLRSQFLEETVESGRRPMCVGDIKNIWFHMIRSF